MSLFEKKKGKLSGPGDMSKHLWHFNGADSYEEFDETDSGIFSFGKSRQPYSSGSKLSHYMAAGGMQCENDEESKGRKVFLTRKLIVKWLVGIAVFWLVFRFVAVG